MRKAYVPKNALPNNNLGVYDTKEYARPAGRSARTQVNQEVKDYLIRTYGDKYKAKEEAGGAKKMKQPRG